MTRTAASNDKTLRWLGYGILSLATVAGLWATLVRFSEGLIVTNMTQHVPWGFWVALYIYFIGLSAGSFLLSTLVYVFRIERYEAAGRLALVQALLCMLFGLWLILIDLGHPERFYKVFVSFNPTSVLAWEALLYTVYVVIILAEMVLAFRPDFVRWAEQGRSFYGKLTFGRLDLSPETLERDRSWLRRLGILGIPVAIGVHGGTGAIFAVAKARPNWFSGLFPIIFLVSALASGGALLTFFTAVLSKRPPEKKLRLVRDLARLTIGVLAFDLLLLASEILVTFYGGIPHEVIGWKLTLFGPYWYVFWLAQLGLGTLLPITIASHPRLGNSVGWLGLAGFLVAVGIIGTRLNIVIPPLIAPAFENLPEAYHHFRFSRGYFPSMNELLGGVFAFTLVVWLFLAASKLLPLDPQEVRQ